MFKDFNRLLYISLFWCFLQIFPSFAQNIHKNLYLSEIVLSFDDAVHYTKLNNANILSSESLSKMAEYKSNASFGQLLPQDSIGAGFKRGDDGKNSIFNTLMSIPYQQKIQNIYSVELSVTQNIFSGGSIIQKIRSSLFSKDAADYDLKITKANISFKLKSAFSGLRYANDYLNLTKEILKRREENLSLITLRYKNGLENKGSVMLADAYLSEAKLDALKAMNSVSVAKKRLADVIGLDSYDDYQFDITGDVPLAVPEVIDVKMIAKQTPLYLKSVANEEMAKAEKYSTIGSFLPSVNFFVNAGRSDNTPHMKNSNWSIGINAKMAIFTGGTNYYSYKAANENYKSASNNRIAVLRDIVASIEEKYSSYLESIERLKVDKNYVEAEIIRAKIARQKYNNGLTSFDDWDRIENSLIAQQKRYIESKRNRVITEAEFEQVLSIGVIE